MKDETRKFVTYEEWYHAQKFQADIIKGLGDDVKVIRDDVKLLVIQVTKANGRTSTLENWTKEAKDKIDNTDKLASSTLVDYKADKKAFWAAWAVGLLFIGTLAALGLFAIKSIIKDDIQQQISCCVAK